MSFFAYLLTFQTLVRKKIDHFTRELKPYVWKEIYITDYGEFRVIMIDEERIEEEYRRIGKRSPITQKQSQVNRSSM